MKKVNITDVHFINEEHKKLEIYVFNVGQGDHILIKFPNLEYGIIDFFYDCSDNIVEPPALSYFKALKNQLSPEEFEKVTISFFCISHNDSDHVKGVSDTVRWFEKEGVFIRDFWLGGAQDEAEFFDFFNSKIKKILTNLSFVEQKEYSVNIKQFKSRLDGFFRIFKEWRVNGFKSSRYKNEEFGPGEYLSGLRPLKKPCSMDGCSAVNLGPLGTQLVEYNNNLTADILRKILCVKSNKSFTDKNLMSHILKIKFGASTLIFGGDTNRATWEECLKYYESPFSDAIKLFGSNESQFVKVSHHGSSTSSSISIWEKILSKDLPSFLGISAGQHLGYNHPDSKTLYEIRKVNSSATILSTNVCSKCLMDYPFSKEHHVWYDDYLKVQKNYHRNENHAFVSDVNDVFKSVENSLISNLVQSIDSEITLGLFAFIFEVDFYNKADVNARVALSSTNLALSCFFENHIEKLSSNCENIKS